MASHLRTGSEAVRPNRLHGMMVMALGIVLLVAGIAMTVISLKPDPESSGRPSESVRAELAYTNHEVNKRYDSGYRWTGVYDWE